MPLTLGSRVGSYEITGSLGTGGMGEVYRALDTMLGRDVAIKVLPEAFAHDAERLARFEREAKTLAALNHPNIAQIYGLERSGAMPALVMELVEGPTLADCVAQGPIPVDEALPIAKQIADALEAAHERGIIHRDLKPANIKLRTDGVVKVLDFGLAKALDPSQTALDASQSPTITSPAMTQMGVILGTAAYMSPEQAKAKQADKRSDVWAFGCVLYEMLTGRRAFEGEDVSDTLASVLKTEPDWGALPGEVPQPIRTLIKRCLEKDRRKRIADVSVALFVLSDLASHVGSDPAIAATPTTVPSRPSTWRWVATHTFALLLASVATGAAVWIANRPPAPRITRFAISPTGTAAITAIALDRELALTPSGTHIVYVGNSGTQLFVRALDQLDSSPLLGAAQPRGPFVSPDGQWIGFFDGGGGDVTLKKVTITGGPAVPVCSFTGSQRAGGTWGEDGTIVFATTDRESGLWRVAASGGEPTVLTKPDGERGDADHLWPEFLPGGQAVLFTIVPATGDIDTAQVAVLDLETGAQRILIQGGSHAHYVASGHLVYGVAGTLRAVAFDVERLEVTSTPVPVLWQVVTTTSGAANFDVADDGTLVYVLNADDTPASAPQRTLAWVDRQGHEEPISAPARAYVYPRLSPDGLRVALDVRDQQNDIWIWSFAGQTLTRLTFNPGLDSFPAWTADGRRLVFNSQTPGQAPGLYWQAPDGTGVPERLTEFRGNAGTGGISVSPDGASVVFSAGSGGGSNDVIILTLDGDRRIQPLVQTRFNERNAEVSPDGRWLSYETNESGENQIYVRPFPSVNSGRWQISTAGGEKPLWARDGQELFYVDLTGVLMSVRVETGATWRASTPAKLLDGRAYMLLQGNPGRTYECVAGCQTVPRDQA